MTWEVQWQIPPRPFHPQLIEFADEAVRETSGTSHRMPSGALHDAAEMASAGVPTVMLFVQSLRGLSHNREEDTRSEDIEASVQALDRLAAKTMAWVAAGEPAFPGGRPKATSECEPQTADSAGNAARRASAKTPTFRY